MSEGKRNITAEAAQQQQLLTSVKSRMVIKSFSLGFSLPIAMNSRIYTREAWDHIKFITLTHTNRTGPDQKSKQ